MPLLVLVLPLPLPLLRMYLACVPGEHPPNQDHDPDAKAQWDALSQDEKVNRHHALCWYIRGVGSNGGVLRF